MSFSGGTTVSPLFFFFFFSIAIRTVLWLWFGADCRSGLSEQWKSMVTGMREAKAK